MAEQYLMLNIDDPKSTQVAEIMSNQTCKKILGLIAEKEMNETEISSKLKIPLNTVGYNMKKLVEAGLIEKSDKFFWSVKGKRINTYKISNKKIVISPKSSFRGIVPALIVSFLGAFGVKTFLGMQKFASPEVGVIKRIAPSAMDYSSSSGATAVQTAAEEVGSMASSGTGVSDAVSSVAANNVDLATNIYLTLVNTADSWLWFMLGALVALFIVLIWNWRKI